MQQSGTRAVLSAIVVASILAASAWAQPIALTVLSDTDDDDDLYRINLATGEATLVGSLGSFDEVEGLSFQPGTGILFGFDQDDGELLTIDLASGTATVVGASADPSNNVGIAFNAAGELFLSEEGDQQDLWRLDPDTGAETLIGSTGEQIIALAFDASGVLYGVSDSDNPGTAGPPTAVSGLYTINTSTGASTLVGLLGVDFDDGGIAFDSAGVLWGLDDDGEIFNIDTTTGAGTIVGMATCGGAPCENFESLALRGGVLAIPTSSPAGLLTLAAVLSLLGWFYLRRHRSSSAA